MEHTITKLRKSLRVKAKDNNTDECINVFDTELLNNENKPITSTRQNISTRSLDRLLTSPPKNVSKTYNLC
ncbi:hypothetical protein RclHR1_06410001 [Rhizophagus clarus]|uniref:Uncharacterized protein n=1 Tax=Rhizophagus clarus TaxID=94130 RepID=A0A2Z6RSQ8_9GLOM|nr:hypothetical protein RclHR1_06410001 [Rhizophagus clarus]